MYALYIHKIAQKLCLLVYFFMKHPVHVRTNILVLTLTCVPHFIFKLKVFTLKMSLEN